MDFAGSEIDFLVKHKGMPAAQVKPMLDRVAGIAAEVGLDYDFDALQHTKTVKAHQALHYAKQHGKQVEMKERLLRAYFVEGRHVGPRRGARDLAAESGSTAPTPSVARPATASLRTPARTRTRRSSTASAAFGSSSSTASTACPAPSRQAFTGVLPRSRQAAVAS